MKTIHIDGVWVAPAFTPRPSALNPVPNTWLQIGRGRERKVNEDARVNPPRPKECTGPIVSTLSPLGMRLMLATNSEDYMYCDNPACRTRCDLNQLHKGFLQIDHIVPRNKGGEHTWENVQLLCARCNAKKGDRPMKWLIRETKNSSMERVRCLTGPSIIKMIMRNTKEGLPIVGYVEIRREASGFSLHDKGYGALSDVFYG